MAHARQAKTAGTQPIAVTSSTEPRPASAVATGVEWAHAIPALGEIKDTIGLRVLAAAKPVTLPVGMTVFRTGDRCQDYLLVLDGSIRVQKLSESGREIVLYRVEAGESCVLTTSCLLAAERAAAEAIAETEVHGVAIPVDRFREGLAHSEGFRRFVFAAYARRLSDLIGLVEQVAFLRVDVRLARHLLGHTDAQQRLRVTHQDLAVELGTAREVVSRQLKEFERRGWVRLRRGEIAVLDAGALKRLVESAGV